MPAEEVKTTEITKTLNQIGLGPVIDKLIMDALQESMSADRIQALVDKELEIRIKKGVNDLAWDNHGPWLSKSLKSMVEVAIFNWMAKNNADKIIDAAVKEAYEHWKSQRKDFNEFIKREVRDYMYRLQDTKLYDLARVEVAHGIEAALGESISEMVQKTLASFFRSGEKGRDR